MKDDKNLYDYYFLRFKGFSLLLVDQNKQIHKIIDNLQFDIDIGQCLISLHPLFPSIRVNQLIDKPIKIQIDTVIINKVVNVLYSLLYL